MGGTDFLTKNVVGEEKAWTGSGGGFSDHFSPPSYQAEMVASYLRTASALPDRSKFNASGRGFPDVAALGGAQNKYCFVMDRKPIGACGTSTATPVVATMVARLNTVRHAKGHASLGFLNPLFYRHPEAFNDVTKGCNCGKVANGCERRLGFPAVRGWDAATGLGTPNFEKLLSLI
eukprot:SAG31_NODE_7951_length_1556_cov_0.888813_2_plen_176_part_00